MKLIIVPGFSIGNKEWSEKIKSELEDKFEIQTVEWNHWQTGSSLFESDNEIQKVGSLIGAGPTFVIAKSIGTWVVMKNLSQKKDAIRKLVLCGIPLSGLTKDGNLPDYQVLTNYPADQLLVLQNENDPWGPFSQVNEFIRGISSKIVVKSMPRADHAYPYAAEFATFLV